MKKSFMFLLGIGFALSAIAQVKISGTVVDSDKYPLPGANVSVKGVPSLGTTTDIDGKFSIEVPNAQSTLVFSFMGYTTTEKPVGTQTSINVTLADDLAALDEVVVVGYGTAKKSDVTGALSRVTEKQIKERPVQNAVQALQGKATGVDITTNSRPGEVGEIRIRGNRSIKADNDPLYVIDGISLSAASMADINPNDIASMEILKDASATAIYGSRGANGVILITTKKGTKGRVTVDYEGVMSFERISNINRQLTAGEYLDYERATQLNGEKYQGAYGTAPDPDRDYSIAGNVSYLKPGIFQAYQWADEAKTIPVLRQATAEEKAMGYADQVPVYNSNNVFDQNWTDQVLRTGVNQNHQISLSAGGENSRVYMSFAYLDQKSPLKDQDYQRYSANLNGEITPRKWLTIGTSINASLSIQNYGIFANSSNTGAKDSYGQALGTKPYSPAYNPDGTLLNTNSGPSNKNVLLQLDNLVNERRQESVMSSVYAEVKFTPWLKYRLNFGVQYRHRRNGEWAGVDAKPVYNVQQQAYTAMMRDESYFSWVVENLLYFDKTWGVHTVGATVLQSAERTRSENLWLRQKDLLNPNSMWYNLGANRTQIPDGYNTGLSETGLMSYMVRLNYSLMNKYLLTATGRWDGASVLAEGNKWDFFPSVALAWKMQEENWLKDVNWLTQLKLRAGFGVTGNSSVGAYGTYGALRQYNYVFNGAAAPGYTPGTIANPELGWEKTSQWNVGIDFGFLKDRLSGTIELYQANTNNLLLARTLPAMSGFNTITSNIGKTRNSGIEISLSSVNINNPNFRWTTDLNWSTNKEEIVELVNGKEDMKGDNWFIGYPIQVFRDYESDGLWQNTPEDARMMKIYKAIKTYNFFPGQIRAKDQDFVQVEAGTEGAKKVTVDGETIYYLDNGFGTIDDNDKVIRGTSRPDWVAGMTNTFNYKNWELSFFVYARVGSLYYGTLNTMGRFDVGNKIWSPTNTSGTLPQPTAVTRTNYDTAGQYTDGTLISIRNISLAYNFPERWLNKITLRRLQIYAQVLNPFIFGGEAVQLGMNTDDQTGWGSNKGGQTNNTILIRSYVVGLRIGL